jgi:hypothetical protein
LRDYQIPAFADVPRSEIYFADTYDTVGPLGAKAQGECSINPVAPAIANAVANATGVRFPSHARPHLRQAARLMLSGFSREPGNKLFSNGLRHSRSCDACAIRGLAPTAQRFGIMRCDYFS